MLKDISDNYESVKSNMSTSWSDAELLALRDAKNHRIIYDGFGYVWEHKLNDEWELHSIFKYREYDYYCHLIYYWSHQWGRELSARLNSKSNSALKEIKSKGRIMKKIVKIASYNDMSVEDKIKLIAELMPDEPQSYIADILGVSRRTVNRHLNNKKK